MSELNRFMETWEREAKKTTALLRTLPADKYDFRPDAGGRSLGELAWHLAEGDGYMTFGIEQGAFNPGARPPGMERPKDVASLADGYERIHQDAVARVKKLAPADLDRTVTFFGGQQVTIRDVLWDFTIMHNVHHRGQLSLMCRLAGGRPVGCFGPTREEMPPKA